MRISLSVKVSAKENVYKTPPKLKNTINIISPEVIKSFPKAKRRKTNRVPRKEG